jgi:hypothetical protein
MFANNTQSPARKWPALCKQMVLDDKKGTNDRNSQHLLYIWRICLHVLAEMGHCQVKHISKYGVPFKFFFLGELGCLHFMVNCLLVGVK